ncbi:MAG TPA: methyltransferase domain-containing protein [Spongiibacteraceae bacterium]|nr:methyltransferase domain-containing protein [Spongiibacteraceae bacterium]
MSALRCPVCKTDLWAEAKRFVCANNHSFDIARQGYVNLLLSSQRASKAPGDSAEMIADRHAFLDAGFYQPLRDRIVELLAQLQASLTHDQTILDLGCGEGYYTAAFAASNREVYGLDIAKPALAIAAKRARSITWCIGTSRALPFHDDSLDIVTTIFCRPHAQEIQRVLRPDGTLLIAGPGANHLRELRDLLYEKVYERENEEGADKAVEGFTLSHSEALCDSMTLRGEHILQLARMTPHYWRAPRERRAQLETIAELTVQTHFVLQMFTSAK